MEQTINYATNIALVDRDGIAVNIIWGLIYQLDEFKRMAADAIVIDDRDVQIGDRYVNGDWFRGEEKLDTRTAQERAAEAEAILDMLYEGGEVTEA